MNQWPCLLDLKTRLGTLKGDGIVFVLIMLAVTQPGLPKLKRVDFTDANHASLTNRTTMVIKGGGQCDGQILRPRDTNSTLVSFVH